ncbi:iron ABC transporter permease [Paenibacillus apiarius]|uniref:Iron ABC transporter permease n=1 Tax=Paenibacillus apiarius TaxID=46240 RepID=A0ABT4DQQ2_9BACL|nr:iron ABC transporter permease [Paenibacillus apiarius]MCY9514043.1 iron ABC transporter permease [Paenibacillus apiarius]MCY9519560.1 iron ABC transporter permease [Paenibacillus apiarius]MCY9552487.1 iron ABC transporter permease [Paenibacillus apiarius]MCY9556316.1 iron ABC transporter permease [Paenibacillus apiarius]MCY9681850.1 iron ABC transporter permease [Paenibacillus apiarius]
MTRTKSVSIWVAGFVLLLLFSAIHMTQGQAAIRLADVLQGVWMKGKVQNILLELRLPRVAIGLIAGAALASAGVMLQTITRNPLASAGTLGINAGAYFFVVLAMIAFPNLLAEYRFLIALFGAAAAALLIMALVGKQLDPVRIALTGMICTMLFSALTSGLQILFEEQTQTVFLWGSGSLVQFGWSGVQFSAGMAAVSLLLMILLSRSLDLLSLGEDVASSLGGNVVRTKLAAWMLAIVASAVTVSVVGPIGFVGLVAPHLVRLMGIQGHRAVLIHSALWGALLLIGADVFGRWLSPAAEVPVGAMTALIGGPWLMVLAYRTGKKHSSRTNRLGGTDTPKSFLVLVLLLSVLSVFVLLLGLSFGGTKWLSSAALLDGSGWSSAAVQFRIPRVLGAFLVGVLLALSGLLFQAVLRNPLAEPSILGVTSGGGVGGLLVLLVFPGLSAAWIPMGAIIGALAAMAIILAITWRSNWEPIMLALMGISVSAIASAIIQILIVRANIYITPALVWLAGSTYGISWKSFSLLLVVVVITVPLVFVLTRKLDLLGYGDEIATGLGLDVGRERLFAIGLGVAMAGFAVSIVGTIGFIGLIAPHIVRRLTSPEHRLMVPLVMLTGGFLLVLADFMGRYLLAPKEVPSGLMIALIGAPYILYLLRRT